MSASGKAGRFAGITRLRKSARIEWLLKFAKSQKCHYCETALTPEIATKDHLTPLCRGGADHIDNIVPACLACNQQKAWRTEDEFRQFISTGGRKFGGISKSNPSPSLEEKHNEPGLLKRVTNERERVSWAWRNPFPSQGV